MQSSEQTYKNTYWSLRENWQLAQNRKERIGELLRENFVFRLLIYRKNTQITEHRRTAHRWTLRYNNDTERWRIIYADSQNRHLKWKGCYTSANLIGCNIAKFYAT